MSPGAAAHGPSLPPAAYAPGEGRPGELASPRHVAGLERAEKAEAELAQTKEQLAAMKKKVNHATCCEAWVPYAGGSHEDGEEWACPECGKVYIHDTNEADGSAWYLK